jgi:hypothetical protein
MGQVYSAAAAHGLGRAGLEIVGGARLELELAVGMAEIIIVAVEVEAGSGAGGLDHHATDRVAISRRFGGATDR